jgi:hypothetical protein
MQQYNGRTIKHGYGYENWCREGEYIKSNRPSGYIQELEKQPLRQKAEEKRKRAKPDRNPTPNRIEKINLKDKLSL